MSRLMEDQLEAHLQEVVRNPELVRIKGAQALERIRAEHSPESRAALIEAIYARAVGRS